MVISIFAFSLNMLMGILIMFSSKTKETLVLHQCLFIILGLESNTHSHNASLGILDEFYNFIALG